MAAGEQVKKPILGAIVRGFRAITVDRMGSKEGRAAVATAIRDAALAEAVRWVVPVLDAPKPPRRRLTVTLPLFATVELLVVAAFEAVGPAVGIAGDDICRPAGGEIAQEAAGHRQSAAA